MLTSPLKAVLSACLQDLRPEVFAYHLPDDFACLWTMQPCSGPVVIVWTETPPDPDLDPVRCQNNLSPIDWAVAYAAAHKTWPKILVLDLQPDFNRSAPLYRRFLEMRPDLFPWLQVLQAKDILLQHIIKCLSADPPTIGPDQRQAHASLLRDARMTLSEGGPAAQADRHAIANIIAPLTLLGDKAKPTLHSGALQRVLRATGLTAPSKLPDKPESHAQAPEASTRTAQAESRQGTPGPTVSARLSTPGPQLVESTGETGAGLHLLLLDDQAQHGWAAWVNDCLPKAAPVPPVTDPGALVSDLTRQLNAASTRDLRFRLKLPGMDESKHPVLLLDLRLFSGKPSEELKFYESLFPLIDRFKDRDDLAWPAFSSTDPQLTAAIKAISQRKLRLESPEHHEALTWLPRILALADMSLPIVLFSSTGRRMLLKRLADYGNIITAFEKPKPGDTEAAQRPWDVASELRSQITLARKWLQPRAWLSLACNSVNSKQSGQQPGQTYKAVIYMDETGSSPNLTFVALVALYTASHSEGDCEKTLTSQFGVNVRTSTGKKWLRANAADVLGKMPAGTNGPKLTLVHLFADKTSFFHTSLAKDDELHDENVGDNLWRQMLRQTIEASLYVVARSLLSPGDRIEAFSVRAPTRTIPPQNPKQEKAVWNRWGVPCEYLGPRARLFEAILAMNDEYTYNPSFAAPWREVIKIPELLKTMEPNQPDRGLRYFNPDGPRPIVEEIMKLYRDSSFCPTADLVRAFSLNSHASKDAREVPILHFLTDALPDPTCLPPGLAQTSGQYGIIMEALLDFNRFILADDRTAALQSVARIVTQAPTSSLHLLVWNEVGQAANALRGAEYRELAEAGLGANLPSTLQAPTLRGTIANGPPNAPNSRFIVTGDGRKYFAPGCSLTSGDEASFVAARDRNPGSSPIAVNIRLEKANPALGGLVWP